MVAGRPVANVQANEPAWGAEGYLLADKKTNLDQQQAFGFGSAIDVALRQKFLDTAFWAPHVATDDQGEATVEVTLPDNLTTWRAVVRGVSRAALVGEGRGRLRAEKKLLVRVDAPRFLVTTDQVTVPVAVHNATGRPQEVRVALGAKGVTLAGDDATLTVPDGGRAVSDRDATTPGPGEVRLTATATAADAADRVEAVFPALPRGIKVVEGRTGVAKTAGGDLQETFLDVPDGAIPGATRLAVVMYPGLDSAILDALLSLDLYPYGCIEQTVHRFLPAIAAREALLQAGSPAATRLDRLDEAIRRGALRLRNLQNQDGSFGWFRGGTGDIAMTAYALRGLTGARKAGVADLDGPIANAVQALARALGQAPDEDVRALAHLALATAGAVVEDQWASTFRRRDDDLSVAGLAWMALAAHEVGRSYDADELVRLILRRKVEAGESTHWKGRATDCFTGSDREATGLAVQALLIGAEHRDDAERGIRWLLENRTDGGFGTTKDVAAFVGAASAWVRANGASAFGGTVDVQLDRQSVRTIEVGVKGLAAKDRRFLVDAAAALSPGRHTLGFRLSGQGDLSWAVRLEAVVKSDDLPAEEQGIAVRRQVLRPEEAPVEGQPPPVKAGYEVLRPAARPRVEARMLERVVAGERVLVRIELEAPRDLDYVLVEDPLPAGFEVLEDTAQGPFAWQERRDDRQVFFVTRLPKGTTVLTYVLQATFWGRFTALGTTAAPMYLPEVHGRAAGYRLEVTREAGRGTDAETAPTPDEVWARAVRLFDHGGRDEAVRLLRELRDQQPLRDEIVEQLEGYLLRAAIDAKDAKEIVRAREALVRRNPAAIPSDWETQRRIAFAYHDIGEYEVAATLDRELVARAFGLRVDWMKTLAGRDREVEGLDDLGLALRSFPISNATADAALRRAVRYRELARPKGREGKPGAPMDAESVAALWDFTAHFAGTPLADVGAYALISALRQSGDLDGAEHAAEDFLGRYPGSVWQDDARFFLAETRERRFESSPSPEGAKAVTEAATPLVDQKFPDAQGRKTWSEYRARAQYLLARVAHVLGDLDRAVKLYREAWEIEDAREAYAFLTEERLSLPVLHTVDLDGGASIPLEYQNVAEVSLKAYPVDLPVLFAVRRTLEGLHDVDLSGIVAKDTWALKPPDGRDHRPHQTAVVLPVETGKAGAWLVVAKAGDHEAKALVIKTDLHVEIQHLGDKARVYVTDPAGAAVREAYVVVSDGQRIRARGMTDGRGAFEAPGVGPNALVVVSKDGRYAVAR